LARAAAVLSFAYFQQSTFSGEHAEAQQLGLEAAEQAVKLDPQDADAHAALAWQLAYNGDFAQSEIEFERALELNPNSADILTFYAGWALSLGQPPQATERAVELAERAIRLNPNGALWTAGIYREVYYTVGRYEEAWRWHETRPRGRNDNWDYLLGGILLAELGRLDEARATVAESLEKFPSMRKAGFPLCASEATLKASPDLIRLPECVKPEENPGASAAN
jgi:tetratricopeptide (TPR) repeat protein